MLVVPTAMMFVIVDVVMLIFGGGRNACSFCCHDAGGCG